MAVTPRRLGRRRGARAGDREGGALDDGVAVAPCAANGFISSASTAATPGRTTVRKPTHAHPTHGEVRTFNLVFGLFESLGTSCVLHKSAFSIENRTHGKG